MLAANVVLLATASLSHRNVAPWRRLAHDQQIRETAATASLKELADEVARTRAQGRDLEERRRAIRAARSVRSWTAPDGIWHMHAQGTPEDGSRIMAAIGRGADAAFKKARAEGNHEKPDAYAFDGLLALAEGTTPSAKPRADILVRGGSIGVAPRVPDRGRGMRDRWLWADQCTCWIACAGSIMI